MKAFRIWYALSFALLLVAAACVRSPAPSDDVIASGIYELQFSAIGTENFDASISRVDLSSQNLFGGVADPNDGGTVDVTTVTRDSRDDLVNRRRYVSITVRITNNSGGSFPNGLVLLPIEETNVSGRSLPGTPYNRAETAAGVSYDPIGALKPGHGMVVDTSTGDFIVDSATGRDDFTAFTDTEVNNFLTSAAGSNAGNYNLFPYGFTSIGSLADGESTTITASYSVPLDTENPDNNLFDFRVRVLFTELGTDDTRTAQSYEEINVTNGVDDGYSDAYDRFNNNMADRLALIGNATRLIASATDPSAEFVLLPNFRVTGTSDSQGDLYLDSDLDSDKLDPNAPAGDPPTILIDGGSILEVLTQPADAQAGVSIEAISGSTIDVGVTDVTTGDPEEVSVTVNLERRNDDGTYDQTVMFESGTFSKTSTGGTASFGDLVVGDPLGTYRIAFSASNATVVYSDDFEVTAGPAATIVTNDPTPFLTAYQNDGRDFDPFSVAQGVKIGPLPLDTASPIADLVFDVEDAFGNVASGGTVIASSDTGTLTGTLTADVIGGKVSFNNLAFDNTTTGSNTITFTVDGVPASAVKTQSFVVAPEPAVTTFRVTNEAASPITSGNSYTFDLAVSDGFNAVARDVLVRVIKDGTTPQEVVYAESFNTGTSATVTIPDTDISAEGGYTATLRVDNIATTVNFTVDPGTFDTVNVVTEDFQDTSTAPAVILVDNTENITFEAVDASGNGIDGVVVYLQVANGPAGGSLSSGGILDAESTTNGTVTLPVSVTEPGLYTLNIVTDPVAPNPVQLFLDAKLEPDATNSTATLNDTDLLLGQSTTLAVTLLDASNTEITGLGAGDFEAVVDGGAPAVDFMTSPFSGLSEPSSGNYEITFTPTTGGSFTIDSISVLGVPISGTPLTLTVTPPDATNSFAEQTSFRMAATGTEYVDLQVTVQDVDGNGIDGYGHGDFTFVPSGSTGFTATSFDNTNSNPAERFRNFSPPTDGSGIYTVEMLIGTANLTLGEFKVAGVIIGSDSDPNDLVVSAAVPQ